MVQEIDRQRLSFNRGSWLRNVSAHTLDDGTITWGQFEQPDIPDFDDDVRYVVASPIRPDALASEFYGNGALWWIIAVKNGLRMPFSQLHTGRVIIIPSPAEITTRLTSEGPLRF